MSDLRDRMFRAMEEHGLGWIDNGKPTAHCWCGYQPQRLGESWHMHVTDAVIAALKEGGFIVAVERHDYGQPRPSVLSAILDTEGK